MAVTIAYLLFAVLCAFQPATSDANGGCTVSDTTNLALRQPTWQSSAWSAEGITSTSDRAVDGDRRGDYYTSKSCAITDTGDNNPWWAVDIGGLYNVKRIVFYNRETSTFRADNLVFGLTNMPPYLAAPTVGTVTLCARGPASGAQPIISVNCPAGLTPARYVVVFGSQPYMQICELEVFGEAAVPCGNGNLAIKKPTWQSSTWSAEGWPSVSSYAVDGDRRGDYYTSKSCSITGAGDNNPWWAVDLGDLYTVNRVVYFNRETSTFRANNLVFGLTNIPPNVAPPNINSVAVCGRGPATGEPPFISVTCVAGLAPARYVVVLSSQAYLQICELEVYGQGQNPCLPDPCKNGGTCFATGTTYACRCIPGWTGSDCSTDVNVCLQGNPCKNGGTCVKFGTSYECKCAANWAGTNCEMGGAACKAILPQNRINCGWGGVTLAQCNERSCCFSPMTGRPACFYAVNDCETMDVSIRADCGFKGISYAQCLGRGCCFDDDDTNTGPVCYRKANPECLGVAAAKRVTRGNAGIQPNECTAKGWCWDSSAVPNCFTRA